MALTEAQKRAQRNYRAKNSGKTIQKTIGATVSPAEAERIKAALNAAGLTNAEALKRAADRIEQGDDLRRDYDPITNTLKPRE